VWGALEKGHMDMGWVARIGDGGDQVAMAIRIGGKSAGPSGFSRTGIEEFTWDVLTGKELKLPFSCFGTVPVDIDGDGIHKLVRHTEEEGTVLIDRTGKVIDPINGKPALVGHFLNHDGEQILSSTPGGVITAWVDASAHDLEKSKQRYIHPFYRANIKLNATGYNRINLGGL